MVHLCQIGVADELAVGVVVARGEGADLGAQAHQVFRLAGKHDAAVGVVAVEQRADADGVPGGDELAGGAVVEDEGELRVQHGEHVQTMLVVQGQQHLAVAAALERVALLHQLPLQRAEAVDLPVAHHIVPAQLERLHARLRQTHDGQPLEAQVAGGRLDDAGHVGAPGVGTLKVGADV